MTDAVKVERRGHTLEITLDRPKVNAIDIETSRKLGHAFCLARLQPVQGKPTATHISRRDHSHDGFIIRRRHKFGQ